MKLSSVCRYRVPESLARACRAAACPGCLGDPIVCGVKHSAVLTWFDTSVSSRGRAILVLGGPDARAARNELEAGWASNRCRDFAIIPIRWQPVWWCLAATLPAAFVAHPGTTPISVHTLATPMA